MPLRVGGLCFKMRRIGWIKHLIIIFSVFSFVFPAVCVERLTHEEVIGYANQIMRNIYNDIWRVRDKYPQLKDFGPQNLSETMELSSYYTKIKKIRIKSAESEAKGRFFRKEEFRGDKDTLYISFSETPKIHGTIAIPEMGVKITDLDLYVLIYSNTDDQFFKHDMINIIKRNAIITEQVSY